MGKYTNALRQVCLHCSTNKANCKKDKCNRHNAIKELIHNSYKFEALIEWLKEENLTKKVKNKLIELELLKENQL